MINLPSILAVSYSLGRSPVYKTTANNFSYCVPLKVLRQKWENLVKQKLQ